MPVIILTQKCIKLLKTMKLTVRVPSELSAKRSVFIRQVDQSVGFHIELQIEVELVENHDYLAGCKVTKIKDFTRIFKMECSTVTQADKALESGLMCFYTRISPHQIKREEYISLQLCFKCYKYESHNTQECPEGEIKHTFKECNSEIKKCVNCSGLHRTMVMACPYKKKIIQ